MNDKQRFEDFSTGDYVTFERSYSLEDFAAFSSLSGDRNPLHCDAGFGSSSSFGRLIVPLHITLAPLSMIAGMVFPGEPSLYLGHEVRATSPVYYEEIIRYSARIETINPAQRVLGLRVLALRGNEVVLDAAMRVQARVSEWETSPSLPVCKASQPALAVVTGAVGEIGSAIASALGANGWRLLLQDRGKEAPRRRLIERLAGLDAKAEFVAADLATADGRAALARAIGAHENIGLIVHSASPPVLASVEDLVAVNFSAFKSLIDAALPVMLLRQKATIILISSIVTERAMSGWEAYSGAKAMAANLANSIDQKYAFYGVRGLAILPGLVATRFSEPYQDGSPELLPEEVADAVLRLVNNDAQGNAVILEVGREKRGRLGFHLPAASSTEGPTASVAAPTNAAFVSASAASSSPAGEALRKVLKLAPDADLSGAELGITPGWDSLKQLELLLEIETTLGIRFSSDEMAITRRFAELDSLCKRKLNGRI